MPASQIAVTDGKWAHLLPDGTDWKRIEHPLVLEPSPKQPGPLVKVWASFYQFVGGLGLESQITFGSLFSGIEGFGLGFERAGMTCRWQVERDEYAGQILQGHWPSVPRFNDVRYCGRHNLESVTVICGGDPCQANSAAGNSRQPSLGGEFIRIVDAIRPRVVVRENPTHSRKDAPWPWWRFRSCLESIGYAVLPFRLRACCLGAEHRRDRLFLLAEDANANSDGLEGRTRQTSFLEAMEPPGLVEIHDWPEIPADLGFNSRAGLPTYVDEVRCLGNAVVPQVAEWIGRLIVNHLTGESRC